MNLSFLERFKIYVAHVQEWRAQFHPLESVNLRYDHQVIVNPDSATPESKPVTAATATGQAAPASPQHKKTSPGKSKKHT